MYKLRASSFLEILPVMSATFLWPEADIIILNLWNRNLRPGKLSDLLEDTKLIKNNRGKVHEKTAFR